MTLAVGRCMDLWVFWRSVYRLWLVMEIVVMAVEDRGSL